MPTKEERQEIADNLRIMCAYGCKYAEQFYDLLVDTVMDEWDDYTFAEVADHIADLVEPEPESTCRNVARNKYYGFECSTCGFSQEEPNDYGNTVDFSEWEYCPKCGAKVVDDD